MPVVASQLALSPLQAEPTRRSEQVSEVLCGERLQVVETRDVGGEPWLFIEGTDGYRGWLPAGETAPIGSDWPGPDPVRIRALQAEVREEAGGDVVRRLVFGGTVRRRRREGARLFVELPGGEAGWMEAAAETAFYAPHPRATIAETFAVIARALLGTPYRWGGRSVHGVDCSGLVQLVLGELGIPLPRDASLQETYFKSRVPVLRREEIATLDVLFWGTGEKATHTGIALDRDRFVHARRWVRVGAFEDGADRDLARSFRGAYRAMELLVNK